jgi:hypothetical protein
MILPAFSVGTRIVKSETMPQLQRKTVRFSASLNWGNMLIPQGSSHETHALCFRSGHCRDNAGGDADQEGRRARIGARIRDRSQSCLPS